jgi:hypothetical protein
MHRLQCDCSDLGQLTCFLYAGGIELHECNVLDALRWCSDFLAYRYLWSANEHHQIAALDTFLLNDMPRVLVEDYGYHKGFTDLFEDLGDNERDMHIKRTFVKAVYVDFASFFVKNSEEDTEHPCCDKLADFLEEVPELGALPIEALIEDLGSNNAHKLSLFIKEMVFGKGWLISGKRSRDFE